MDDSHGRNHEQKKKKWARHKEWSGEEWDKVGNLSVPGTQEG